MNKLIEAFLSNSMVRDKLENIYEKGFSDGLDEYHGTIGYAIVLLKDGETLLLDGKEYTMPVENGDILCNGEYWSPTQDELLSTNWRTKR